MAKSNQLSCRALRLCSGQAPSRHLSIHWHAKKNPELIRSSPDSLAATLAAPPSMSLIRVVPFLDFSRNDRRRVFHTPLKDNLLLGARLAATFQACIHTK